jgi:hypothetical protein
MPEIPVESAVLRARTEQESYSNSRSTSTRKEALVGWVKESMNVMDKPTGTTLDAAIKANLGALAELLADAANHADAGERNIAIGAIVDLDRLLADAIALHGATIALHRRAQH